MRARIGYFTLVAALAALAACSQKTAQEKGAELAATKLDMATGIGDTLQAKGGQAGESVASGVGSLIRGMERGIMKSGLAIAVDPTLAAAGLTVTKVQDAAAKDDRPGGLDAYVVAASPASGTLHVLLFDAMGEEIGRANVRIERGADEARYEAVPLDRQVDRAAIRKVAFTFKPGTAS